MRKVLMGIVLALVLLTASAMAETQPLTGEEIKSAAEQILSLAETAEVLNDPAAEEAESEDGYAFQYDFGVIYADRNERTDDAQVNAILVMDSETAGPRGISIDWDVNQVMKAVPCENGEMLGNRHAALLYLEGDRKNGYTYGRVERDGQRIYAMEYGEVDPATEKRTAMVLEISGDGVASLRLEISGAAFSREESDALYTELEKLGGEYGYYRVPRSQNGADLEEFHEGDLDFSELSFRTAEPFMLGEDVEDMLMDNGDGTWLRRIDGDGFEAVFTCDRDGGEARMISYTILSSDIEGPRGVRLGDLFHEDFSRFRSGEGAMDENSQTEILYGEPGKAPYGLAEYGDGTEMILRYVTPTLGGPDVELLLRYQNAVLSEIMLHTVNEE